MLNNGTPYNVKIVAVYESGDVSQPSLPAAGIPGTTAAPTGASVVSGNERLVVKFTPPEAPGGSPIVNYSYMIWEANTNDTRAWVSLSPAKTTSPIVIGGLTNLTSYRLKIRTETQHGGGQESVELSGVPNFEAPFAPTITNVSAGNSSLTVAFTPPAVDGGKPITGYKYSINNGATKLTYDSTESPIDIENLTNGTKYSVILYAVNEVGTGEPSNVVEGIPSEGLTPSAPRITQVTSGVKQLTLDFTPPTKTNGYPVTRYQYKLNSNRWKTRSPEADLSSPLIISGLASNKEYRVQMRAINAGGAGAASAIALGTTLKTAPEPLKITHVDFHYSAPDLGRESPNFYITFLAQDDGGSPITHVVASIDDSTTSNIELVDEGTWYNPPTTDLRSYRAAIIFEPNPNDGTRQGAIRIFDMAYDIYEIPQGSSTMVYVPVAAAAVNSVGQGQLSEAWIYTNDPDGPPLDAPTNVTVDVLSSTSILINFTPPSRPGTIPATGYQYSLDDGFTYSSTVQATNNIITVTGLTPGTPYKVRLKGVNGQDYAKESDPVNVITGGEAPTAPTIFSVSGLNNSLVVQFSQPVVPGGVILDYEYSLNGAPYVSSGVTTSPITITGTLNDTLYNITVRAINPSGIGAASNTAPGISGQPSAPVITSIQRGAGWLGGGGELKVYFNPPLSDGGSQIIKYHYSIDGGTNYIELSNAPTAAANPITISNLVNGQSYSVLLKAENLRSMGSPSAAVSATPYTVPSEPTITQVVVDSTKLATATVHFTPPASNGGSPIISYDYTVDGGTTWQNSTSAVIDNYILLATPKSNGASANVVIRAINAAGGWRVSNRVTAFPITAPAPTGALSLAAAPGNPTQLILTFNPPLNNGGSPVTHYEYTIDSLLPSKFYIPAPATPGLVTYQLPHTFNYGDVVHLSLSAINFGASSGEVVTPSSGVGLANSIMHYIAPSSVTMPSDWVQLTRAEQAGFFYKQLFTLKLPNNPSNTYIGTNLARMQSLVTKVDVTYTIANTSRTVTVFDRFSIKAKDLSVRTSMTPAGSFTFTPDSATLPDFVANCQMTFVAYNDYFTSAPYTVTTDYVVARPQLVTAPPPGSTPPAGYKGITIINSSCPTVLPSRAYYNDNTMYLCSIVELYVDTKNTEIYYKLEHRPTGYNTPDGFRDTSTITQEVTLPINKDYYPYEHTVYGRGFSVGTLPAPDPELFGRQLKPCIYDIWCRTFVPNRATNISSLGLPFEGEPIAGGKQMLSIRIMGFGAGDEVKLTLAAKDSSGVTHPSQTITLHTDLNQKATVPFPMQPCWWACMPRPVRPLHLKYLSEKQYSSGYLTVIDPAIGLPLTEEFYVPADVPPGPTYFTAGGFGVRVAPLSRSTAEFELRLKALGGLPGMNLSYDIEVYRLPSNVFLGWRFRGENDLQWRWFARYNKSMIDSIGGFGTNTFDELGNERLTEFNHGAYHIYDTLRSTPAFPDVWRHQSLMLEDVYGPNRALLSMTLFDRDWPKLKTVEGAIDPRQLEFITCMDIEPEFGIPTLNIGPIVPYYLNTMHTLGTEFYASPPLSSGRVSVEAPKVNYNWSGAPAAPYAWDGYWTPTPFQPPTAAQLSAFRARYPDYFNKQT
jgi:hypothetical protein